ncbi:pyruvate kinase [Sinobacterium caligoides]|uniref:Pyruvate kinase n=1 Tax=Sinobacterium caligoides TaxID=933926 RepID=A0A3N2D4T1_9GAMM|nr:pyruvate kinase [Sinobacterium caligoides]ROR94763.1 pyruvate kinase [Sinobacterium caligoides]
MPRRTKIIATLGPATDHPDTLKALLQAGANVLRLNFSHGDADDHRERARLIRQFADELGLSVAILGDLQGPKIRIARFSEQRIVIESGDRFTLDTAFDPDAGNQQIVGVDYPPLADQVGSGDKLLLDDGRIVLEVDSVDGSAVHCIVRSGGTLSNNKGLNRLGGGLAADALTEKDLRDIKLAAELRCDYVAVSFPGSPDDLHQARQLLEAEGCDAGIVAKIERAETVHDRQLLEQMIIASDAVMVARGDLGVEIGDAELVGVQKHMIERARQLNRCVITATQMMESMIEAPMPTRAEVFDVANAVLDGTDAVMLSAETAAGKYPIAAVEAMARTCIGAEKQVRPYAANLCFEIDFERTDQSIAMAAMYVANHTSGIRAILCLTESGSTPMWMSRLASNMPIYAVSRHADSCAKMALYRGVTAIEFDLFQQPQDVEQPALQQLLERGHIQPGDKVIVTHGDITGLHGGTNTLRIITA